MTLVDLDELLLPYLAEHPPVHILVARLAGWKRPLAEAPANAGAQDLMILRQGLGERADVHTGFDRAAVLDFAALKAAASKGNA